MLHCTGIISVAFQLFSMGAAPGGCDWFQGILPSTGIGKGMNVVRGLVAGDHFEFLIHIHGQNVRRIHAVLLIKDRLRRWHLGQRARRQALGNVHNNVSNPIAGTQKPPMVSSMPRRICIALLTQ